MSQALAKQTAADPPARYSPDEVKDKLKSQAWRLNHLYYIIDKNGRRVQFKMNWAQVLIFKMLWYLNIILKARQLGCTTFICVYMLDICLFYSNTHAAVIAHNKQIASKMFEEKVHFPYKNLPDFLKSAKVENFDTLYESTTLLKFGNNSSFMVGTTLRGGTYQYLLVSEYGKICAKTPEKAKEIRTGALNTVAAGQFVWIESTAEGADGHFFQLCQVAQNAELEGTPLTMMDYRFIFFPWWREPEYMLEGDVLIDRDLEEYFEELEAKIEIKLKPGQKAWYAKKLQTQQDDMKREYPSTPEEAFEASIVGAYYGKQMVKAREQGRIGRILHNPENLVHTGWDLGIADEMAIWCFQMNTPYIDFVNYYENTGEGMGHYIEWLLKQGYKLGRHFVPHDIKKRDLITGKNRIVRAQEDFGITLEMIPRAEDVIEDINDVRRSFYRYRFDKKECKKGIQCLDHYRKEWNEKTESYRAKPLHNWASNGADAGRTATRAINDELDPQHLDDTPTGTPQDAGDRSANWMGI
jgi:hypothetical protein